MGKNFLEATVLMKALDVVNNATEPLQNNTELSCTATVLLVDSSLINAG